MSFLRSPKNKLLLACGMLAALLLLAPHGGLSAAAAARVILGVGALAAGGLWLARRSKGSRKFALPARLTVAARTGLSNRCGLALVEADGHTYLVAYGDGFAQIQLAASATRVGPERVPASGKVDA